MKTKNKHLYSIGTIKPLNSKDIFEIRYLNFYDIYNYINNNYINNNYYINDINNDVHNINNNYINKYINNINYHINNINYHINNIHKIIFFVNKTNYDFNKKILNLSFISHKGFFGKVERQIEKRDFTILVTKPIEDNFDVIRETNKRKQLLQISKC